MNVKILFILAIITLIGGFLRFYQLGSYPVQLNHDEISQLYDVSSIVQTGKDIYGNFLPLVFPSTGDFKVGHYIYITILPYLIFGMREVTVRIPSAFFGTLIIPAAFLFISQLTRNWKLALVSSAAVAITPSEIFYSRKSFESIIGIFFVFSGLFLLFKELDEDKKGFGWLITSLLLALPMYIYTAYTIIIPFFIVTFATLFWKNILLKKKKFLRIFLIWVVFILPLVYITVSNPDLRFRASSVSIFQDVSLGNQLQSIKVNNSIVSFVYQLKVILEFSFTKYLKQFDPVYVFANGLDFTNQGMLGMGPLLLFQLPFFLIGIIFIVRSGNFLARGKFLLILLFLAMIPSGFTFEKFSPHRSVFAFSIMSIISSFGFFWFLQIAKKAFSLPVKLGIFSILGLLLIFNIVYFAHMYTVNLPYEKSQGIHYPYKQAALFAWSKYSQVDHIVVDPVYGQSAPVRAVAAHYYLAYYGGYPPEKFQKDLKMTEAGMSFDKFSIRNIDWRKDRFLQNTLIIASPWSISIDNIDKNSIIKRFDFYDGQPAFYAISL